VAGDIAGFFGYDDGGHVEFLKARSVFLREDRSRTAASEVFDGRRRKSEKFPVPSYRQDGERSGR